MATNAVLTTVGKNILASFMAGTSGYVRPQYVYWGTGAGTSAVSDTDIFSPSADEARVLGTLSTNGSDTLIITGLITCINVGKSITNAGVNDALTAGRLFIHGDFSPAVVLNIGDSISFTFRLQFT